MAKGDKYKMFDLKKIDIDFKSKKNKILIYSFIYLFFSIIIGAIYLYDLKINNTNFFTNNPDLQNKMYILYFIAFSIITLTLGVLIFVLTKYKKLEIHKKFFISGLLIGSMYLGLSPFYTGSDELAHFCRIYEVSTGNLITPINSEKKQGSVLPKSIDGLYVYKEYKAKYSDIDEMMKIPLNKEDTTYYGNYYPTSAVYSPLQYIPQIIGVILGKTLNLNIYFIGLLGRIFGFVAWLLICTYSIKVLPAKKIFISLLLLTPISISFATTLSGDLMTNAMVILFISHIYNIWYNKRSLTKKDMVILTVSAIMVSICKVVYLPIVLLLFIIPKKSFGNSKKYFSINLIIIILAALISGLWLKETNNLVSLYYTNTELQKDFIFNNPFQYIIICIKTFFVYFDNFIMSTTAGSIMYNTNVNIYPIVSILFFANLIIALFGEKVSEKVSKLGKTLIVFIIGSVIVLIFTALYIQYTLWQCGVGHQYVEGVQARYFIPLIMLSVLLFQKRRIIFDINKVYVFSMALQLPVLLTMFIKFLI